MTILLLGVCATQGLPQSATPADDKSVYVTSWKSGRARVREHTLKLSLKPEFPAYEFDFFDITKRRHFRLHFRHVIERPVRQPGLPCWSTTLREISAHPNFKVTTVGYDLLGQPSGTSHYFPRESWAGFFCPLERPNRGLDGLFYPVKTERVFTIEMFRLTLSVSDYRYDQEQNVLSKLDLTIELRNL